MAADPPNRLVASELESALERRSSMLWRRLRANLPRMNSSKHLLPPCSGLARRPGVKPANRLVGADDRMHVSRAHLRTLIHEVVADIDSASLGARSHRPLGGLAPTASCAYRSGRRGQRNITCADIHQAVRQLVLSPVTI